LCLSAFLIDHLLKTIMIRFLLLSTAFITINTVCCAQSLRVQGVVQDSEGNSIPGVNVLLKGSTRGTTTDANGSYSLEIAGGDGFLIFSFLGFKNQEVSVANRTSINVTLTESIEQLQEIVVTALGVEKEKKTLGYASQSVPGNELVTARESNVINSLSGRIAGVQINQSGTGPGGTSKVVIRGYNSIDGNNKPLYVIDGIPMTNPQGGGEQFGGVDYGDGISNINPDDIESFNVLKGPSATALYGSRGQSGVIMITTKKGKARKGLGIEVNSNLTLEQPLVLPDFQDKFGRGSNGNFPVQPNGTLLDNIRDSWGPRTLGQTTVNGIPLVEWTGEQKPYYPQPNNIKDYFRTGTSLTNSIALSGGDEKTQARVSLTHLKRENSMPNSDFERLSVSLNIRSKLSDKFTVEGKINYINQQAFNRPNLTLSPDNPMNSLIQMPRSIDLDDLREFRSANGLPRLYTNATGTDQWQNPFWAAYLNTNNDERDRVLGYLLLEYKFNDWLKMHIRTGTDFYNDFRQNRNATNTIYRVTPDKSFYSEYYERREERNSDILITASKKLSDKINFSANLGGNLLHQQARSITNTAQGLNIPDFFVIQNARSVVASEGASQKKVHSVYGSVQIDYNDYLFVELTARNDWSSALPSSSFSYFYPSISTSLIFTEMIDMDWGPLSYGKLRASYAGVGNDTNPHQLQLNYVVNGLSHGGQTFGQVVPTQPPVALKPERTTSFEVGIETGFFNNRLSADITYYHAGTVNQILRNLPVSKASGFDGITINAGLIVNQGIEITLRGTPIQTADFTYKTYLNFTRNRSSVEKLAENVERYQLGGSYDQFGVSIQAEVGGAFGDIYANKPYLRDPATGKRIIGSNGLPLPDNSGIKKIGNFQPDFLMGFGHELKYKNISLGVLFDIRGGGDIFSFSNSVAAANGNAKYTQNNRLEWYAGAGGYVADGVLQDGSPNTVEVNPQTYWQNVGGRASNYAEEFLYDGGFIKFRELTIGYTLPKKLIKNTFLTAVNLSLVGRNLFILHKNTPGFDPEATFTSGNDQGIEAFAFPSTRSIGFNLKLTL
jgi:TonB-linked SusC/RagA family outer membrane protein